MRDVSGTAFVAPHSVATATLVIDSFHGAWGTVGGADFGAGARICNPFCDFLSSALFCKDLELGGQERKECVSQLECVQPTVHPSAEIRLAGVVQLHPC